jgi:hypothetical protein
LKIYEFIGFLLRRFAVRCDIKKKCNDSDFEIIFLLDLNLGFPISQMFFYSMLKLMIIHGYGDSYDETS